MSKFSSPKLAPPIQSQVPVYLDNTADEIDLVELFQSLWQKKKLIIASSALCTVLGGVFALLSPATYEAKGYLRPTSIAQLSAINETGIMKLGPEELFIQSGLLLNSRGLRREAFLSENIQSVVMNSSGGQTAEQLFDSFNKQLHIQIPDSKKEAATSDSIVVSFRHHDPEFASTVVNESMRLTQQAQRQEIEQNLRSIITDRKESLTTSIQEAERLENIKRQALIERMEDSNRLAIEKLTDELSTARQAARQQRLDRMDKLREALSIARSLNITKPSSLSQLSEDTRLADGGMAVTTEINSQEKPLFLLGQELLSAELEVLGRRTNDDFASATIRQLESRLDLLEKNRDIDNLKRRQDDKAFVMEQTIPQRRELQRLSNINIDYANIQPVRLDQTASVPGQPINPRKALILSLALVAGLMLGVFVALTRIAIENASQRRLQTGSEVIN